MYWLIHLIRLLEARENSAATIGTKGCCLVKGLAVHGTRRWNWSPEFSVLNFGRSYMLSDKTIILLIEKFWSQWMYDRCWDGTNVIRVLFLCLLAVLRTMVMTNAERSINLVHQLVAQILLRWFALVSSVKAGSEVAVSIGIVNKTMRVHFFFLARNSFFSSFCFLFFLFLFLGEGDIFF